MTQITDAHVEWAVVGRLKRMLEEPPAVSFNVTHSYAVFTSILCWVMQRIRIRVSEIDSTLDEAAASLFQRLRREPITDQPWRIYSGPDDRLARIGSISARVPAPINFAEHTAERFLTNLRDATAHGDARTVLPFHVEKAGREARQLVGFTFKCSERDRKNR